MSPASAPALQYQFLMPPPAAAMMPANPTAPVGIVTPEIAAKDNFISWCTSEFTAANAIIDALTNHILQVSGCDPADYNTAFSAINYRRRYWFPLLHKQKYFPINEVIRELKSVQDRKTTTAAAASTEEHQSPDKGEVVVVAVKTEDKEEEEKVKKSGTDGGEVVDDEEETSKCAPDGGGFHGGHGPVDEDSPDSEITDTGSHEEQHTNVESHIEICENHEDCGSRREQIKMSKGFVAKEPVKGHTVNVVKGLKMYGSIFTEGEISRMNDFVYELRAAGQNGELPGGSYVLFNKEIKGNKREQIHLGVPLFETAVKDNDQKTNLEPIPVLLQSVINHLVQWQIIPESRQPNGCIINYFEEDEHSQPYLKPPHVDQPICTLLLSETTVAFGRTLTNDGEGNFKGSLMLSLNEGSVLLMRNNSADMARHAVCSAPTKRVSLTFFRVRPHANYHYNHLIHANNSNHKGMMMLASPPQAMPMWQPAGAQPNPCFPNNGGFQPMNMNMIPNYGVIREPPPMVMLAHPMSIKPAPAAMIMNQGKMMMPNGGTGVFLPWASRGSRKQSNKHLPPRAQRSKLLALESPPLTHPPSPCNAELQQQLTHPPPCNAELQQQHLTETMSDPGSDVKKEI